MTMLRVKKNYTHLSRDLINILKRVSSTSDNLWFKLCFCQRSEYIKIKNILSVGVLFVVMCETQHT